MATEPTTTHTARFRRGVADGTDDATDDGRLVSPTFARNAGPVTGGLCSFLETESGFALEIGSGTGQHICTFAKALPRLIWTPSEPDRIHRTSIAAWRKHEDAPTRLALSLDAAGDWSTLAGVQKISPLTLVLSLNVIHIAPSAVASGIIRGAGRCLKSGGFLAFYGPFREAGAHTGEGNRLFDERLRADNPQWGVRDTDKLKAEASSQNLAFHALLEMPANNRLLVFRRP
jgi:Protein of unknown function (DUF938)